MILQTIYVLTKEILQKIGGLKSREGYNGARTVVNLLHTKNIARLTLEKLIVRKHLPTTQLGRWWGEKKYTEPNF